MINIQGIHTEKCIAQLSETHSLEAFQRHGFRIILGEFNIEISEWLKALWFRKMHQVARDVLSNIRIRIVGDNDHNILIRNPHKSNVLVINQQLLNLFPGLPASQDERAFDQVVGWYALHRHFCDNTHASQTYLGKLKEDALVFRQHHVPEGRSNDSQLCDVVINGGNLGAGPVCSDLGKTPHLLLGNTRQIGQGQTMGIQSVDYLTDTST
mmetsp:Transcript_4125/g.6894  ORF Transcript_4125/g.6894 Transcript_4125/m.6894 type:complete len:211 (-) Transcript_4125:520-1152(-)